MNLPQLAKFFSLPDLHRALPEAFRQLQAADKQSFKRGLDIEVPKAASLILTGDDDVRYKIEVVAGSITATAL